MTRLQHRLCEFLRDNPGLDAYDARLQFNKKYPDDQISKGYFHAVRGKYRSGALKLEDHPPTPIEAVKLYKWVQEVGGMDKFKAELAKYEEYGTIERIKQLLAVIESADL